jgi:NAD(P)-dependent dehydrogenase (short-subunit alcohol dehydrogenase family)
MQEGKVVVVTGAGRGLGRASALAFAQSGWRVAIFSRTLQELDSLALKIESLPGTAAPFQGDVSSDADVHALRDSVLSRFGQVDVLLNNAAVIGPPRFFEDEGFEGWRRTFEINLNGPCRMIQAFLPTMLKRGRGDVISITSGLARMTYPRFCAYGASKAGIEQMTRCLSSEYGGFGLRFYAVDPGVMDTPMQERLRTLPSESMGEIKDRFVSLKEHGRLRDPSEVAGALVDLAENGGRSGSILSVSDLRGTG